MRLGMLLSRVSDAARRGPCRDAMATESQRIAAEGAGVPEAAPVSERMSRSRLPLGGRMFAVRKLRGMRIRMLGWILMTMVPALAFEDRQWLDAPWDDMPEELPPRPGVLFPQGRDFDAERRQMMDLLKSSEPAKPIVASPASTTAEEALSPFLKWLREEAKREADGTNPGATP